MMTADDQIDILDARVKRREGRRDFFRLAFGAAAVGTAATLLPGDAGAQTITDADILNFALNLEYLEANFYSFAAFGTAITMVDGTGTQGAATGGRQVAFTDPVVSAYAREIAQDEIAHVNFLRTQLGAARVAQPTIDLGTSASGAFSSAARAAGIITDASATFDPYASDENFLLAAFIFEDVGVSAYKGASPLIADATYLGAAAGILATEAYHAGLIRTELYRKGIGTPATAAAAAIPANPTLITNAGKISDARDALDGTPDIDQGIANVTVTEGTGSNITPLDGNGLAYSRSTGQVLNIVYLNKAQVSMGGFFPAGLNGTIKTSANNA